MNEPTTRSKGIRAMAPRIPPHNLHAEQTVLGAILLGGHACLEPVLASLRGSDFFKDAHRDIYRAMNALAGRREAVDAITVEEELRHLGSLAAAGGAAALALLMERGCVAINLPEYIRIVKSHALRRELIQTGMRLVQAAFDDQSPGPEVLIDETVSALVPLRGAHSNSSAVCWANAISAPKFLATADTTVDYLESRLLVRGAVTGIFAPRGLGKTQVALAIAVKLARTGHRVLLLDRDNPPREVRRRLRRWGADEASTLRILTRGEAPPLSDTSAWTAFPASDYDVVILDSLDATTEGAGEGDSAKPAVMLSRFLNIVRREDGPAGLVLGNTIKSARHSRGSGIIEDRFDICYEVRDATGFTPTGTLDWWLELPPAGVDAWGQRAGRRKRRTTYRLAFVPSKFRLDQEPEPFLYEIDCSTDRWILTDVTEEMVRAGEEAKAGAVKVLEAQLEKAAEALRDEVVQSHKAGAEPFNMEDATGFLIRNGGLKRKVARELLETRNRKDWLVHVDTTRRGHPKLLFPVRVEPIEACETAAREDGHATPLVMQPSEPGSSAGRMNTGRRKTSATKIRRNATFLARPLSPPTSSEDNANSNATTKPGLGSAEDDLLEDVDPWQRC